MAEKLSSGPKASYDLTQVGSGLSRGPNLQRKATAAAWSNTWPAPGATLDLDFANNRGFVRGVGQGGAMDAVTFTRASNGWYVDNTGTLQQASNNAPRFDWASTAVVPQVNLLQQTDNFANSYWTTTNATTTANTLSDTVSTGTHRVYGPGTSSRYATVSYSVTLQANTANFAILYLSTDGANAIGVGVDLSTGTLSSIYDNFGNFSIKTSSITSLGGGKYRVTLSAGNLFGVSTNAVGFTPQIYLSNSLTGNPPSYTGTGTGVFISNIQLEAGSSASAYQAVAQPTTNTPLAATSTSNGLLIEESRTNRLLWCRDATQSNWTKTNVTAAKNQTGIDGVANAASSLTASSTNGTCIQTVTLASGSRTGSVYLKRITGTGTVQVTLDGSTWSTVDLSNGLWNRIVLSGTVTNPTVGILIATNGDAVAMDYGQIEDGAFATTPILTTTATATRAADVTTILAGQWFNTDKGIVSAKLTTGLNTNGTNRSVFTANSTRVFLRIGTVNNVIMSGPSVTANTNNITGASKLTDGVTAVVSTGFARYKMAACIASYSIETNANDMIFTGPSTSIAIGSYIGSSEFFNGTLGRVKYFPVYLNTDVLKDTVGAT